MNRGLSFNTKGSALNPTFSPTKRPSLEIRKWHGFEPRQAPKQEVLAGVVDAHEERGTHANFKINEGKIRRRNRWYRMYRKRPRLINIVEKIGKWVEKTVISVRLSRTTAKQILNRLKETYELLRKKPEEPVQKFGKYSYSH